jgi:AcrR family transcriptional regulator
MLETGELDMGEIARRAGVGRSSLYRMCGDREGLREMLLRWLAEAAWEAALHQHRRKTGRPFVLAVLDAYTRFAAGDPGFRKSLQAEPERTLSLATDHRRSVQGAIVERVEKLLVDHADDFDLNMPLDQVTYAIVRLSESFVYADTLAGREPDLKALAGLVSLLLPPRKETRRSRRATDELPSP